MTPPVTTVQLSSATQQWSSVTVTTGPAVTVSSATTVTVTLIAFDSECVPQIWYSLNGGDLIKYQTPFNVAARGDTLLTCKSADLSSNWEVAQYVKIRIKDAGGTGGASVDKEPPRVDAIVSPSAWSKGPVTVTINASDDAGPVTVVYAIGSAPAKPYSAPFTIDAEGRTAVTYTATDAAGRTTSGTLMALIDKTPPTVSAADPVTSTAGVSVGARTEDLLSGVGTLSYRVDSGAWVEGPHVLISAPGTHTVTFEARDLAGNVGTAVATAVLPTPTTLSIVGPSVPVSFSKGAILSGVLTDTAGVPTVGSTIGLERLVGSKWLPVAGARATTGRDGRWAISARPSSVTRYRAVFVGGGALLASGSTGALVRVGAALSVPVVTGKGRVFSVTGKMLPAHASTVKIEVYRSVGRGWALYRRFNAKTTAGGKYALGLTLPKGKWRVRATHSDAGHAPSSSGFREVVVR